MVVGFTVGPAPKFHTSVAKGPLLVKVTVDPAQAENGPVITGDGLGCTVTTIFTVVSRHIDWICSFTVSVPAAVQSTVADEALFCVRMPKLPGDRDHV